MGVGVWLQLSPSGLCCALHRGSQRRLPDERRGRVVGRRRMRMGDGATLHCGRQLLQEERREEERPSLPFSAASGGSGQSGEATGRGGRRGSGGASTSGGLHRWQRRWVHPHPGIYVDAAAALSGAMSSALHSSRSCLTATPHSLCAHSTGLLASLSTLRWMDCRGGAVAYRPVDCSSGQAAQRSSSPTDAPALTGETAVRGILCLSSERSSRDSAQRWEEAQASAAAPTPAAAPLPSLLPPPLLSAAAWERPRVRWSSSAAAVALPCLSLCPRVPSIRCEVDSGE